MSVFPLDLDQAAQHLMQDYPPAHELHLQFESWKVRLKTNSKELVDDLADYYGPFVAQAQESHVTVHAFETEPLNLDWDWTRKTPDPGKTKIKEAWVNLKGGRAVRKLITGMTFLFGGDYHLAVGPCVKNSNQIINFINNRHIQWHLEKGCLLGHAAGVSFEDKGLALAGFSGAGKSTLALHIMSLGAHFVSNDRLMVENKADETLMYGVAKLPRINPGTALNNPDLASVMPAEDKERFSKLPTKELWDLEHKYDAHIDECFGPGKFHLSAPMNGLFILHWTHSGEPMEIRRVNPDERRDLLAAFMKTTGLFYLPPQGDEEKDPPAEVYVEGLKKVAVYELFGGVDFAKAAELGMRFLKTGDVK
ncbi:HprK-related kinase B [Desulfatibacillum alkenivorans DSM 16219]|uniref:HprK-related kinase B n=1 Tax=Desulfatibacillum alkenivorans DSM 16219 TaxID=1121393 RepID=A0A1M6YBA7_9BACT|nr:HprK-related kinase B [Desulfatibacillum alkenivorans]SHL15574.1 HprK-related kinase B [Desulfatibacillum alkenivorans DSM 16219]